MSTTSTTRGVAIVPVIAPSREQQLERELNDCYAQLELKQAALEDLGARVEASGASTMPDAELVCIGGGMVYEADGYLWLRQGDAAPRKLWPATAEEARLGGLVRERVQAMRAARQGLAS